MADKKLVVVDEAMLRQVFDAFRGLREWVKAVPEDAPLPVMRRIGMKSMKPHQRIVQRQYFPVLVS